MKEKLSKEVLVIFFVIGILIIYNLVPYFASKIEYESYNVLEFLSLVIINPLCLSICGVIFGMKHGFSWFLPSILAFCFIPTVFIFFDLPYLFYMGLYILFVLPSELFGISLKRLFK